MCYSRGLAALAAAAPAAPRPGHPHWLRTSDAAACCVVLLLPLLYLSMTRPMLLQETNKAARAARGEGESTGAGVDAPTVHAACWACGM